MSADASLLWGGAAFFVLVIVSAFFSAAETALFSLTRSQIDELSERKDPQANRLNKLLSDPRRLLIVLLSGNTIINIVAATVAALVTSRLLGEAGKVAWLAFIVQVAVVTLVILMIGEILPKLTAIRDPLKWSLRMSGMIRIVAAGLYPVVAVLLPFTDSIARMLGVERRRLWVSEDEIKTLVEVGEEHGVLEKSEKEMIHSIFEFGDTTVREIMVPRMDMTCLDVATPLKKVLETVHSSQHTRIPIFDGAIDNIIGILHTKDLLLRYPFDDSFQLKQILRKPSFVPETKLIQELLKQFQDQRLHMAIVVDEYGGTAGLVTLEDVIEEIVGDIQDEHDTEKPLWSRIDERTVIADARLDVWTVNQVLEDEIIPMEQDFETLGGFLLSELGDFPEVKTSIEYHNFTFVVEEVKDHRIGRVRIIRREIMPELPE
jgi:gliding motility-associated protein GldE